MGGATSSGAQVRRGSASTAPGARETFLHVFCAPVGLPPQFLEPGRPFSTVLAFLRHLFAGALTPSPSVRATTMTSEPPPAGPDAGASLPAGRDARTSPPAGYNAEASLRRSRHWSLLPPVTILEPPPSTGRAAGVVTPGMSGHLLQLVASPEKSCDGASDGARTPLRSVSGFIWGEQARSDAPGRPSSGRRRLVLFRRDDVVLHQVDGDAALLGGQQRELSFCFCLFYL